MGYGAPLKNQNKGYDAQEKKDLIGDMPIPRVASGGTFLSKHMSPISMGMGKGMKSDSPAGMHGSPMHKYDDVVLGGNRGDISKTNPGKKDK